MTRPYIALANTTRIRDEIRVTGTIGGSDTSSTSPGGEQPQEGPSTNEQNPDSSGDNAEGNVIGGSPSPQTSDDFDSRMYIMLMLSSVIMLLLFIIRKWNDEEKVENSL